MMRERLVREFESAKTWETARLLRPKIVSITEFSDAQLSRIEKSLTENEKVATAYGVPEAIKQLLARHGR